MGNVGLVINILRLAIIAKVCLHTNANILLTGYKGNQ